MQKRFATFLPVHLGTKLGSNSSHTYFLFWLAYHSLRHGRSSISVQYSPSTSAMSAGHEVGPVGAVAVTEGVALASELATADAVPGTSVLATAVAVARGGLGSCVLVAEQA